MKNLKKLSALAISLMMVFSFAGCESSDDSSKKDSSSKTETTTTTSASESSSDIDSGSSSDTGSKTGETGLKDGIYTSENYSIELGSDWKESNSTSGMVIFQLISDPTTSINIMQQSIGSQKITVDQLKDQTVKQFEAQDGCKVTNSESTKIDGNDACVVYLNIESATGNAKTIQAYVITDSDAFIFTFATSEDKYDELEPKVQKMLESFKMF